MTTQAKHTPGPWSIEAVKDYMRPHDTGIDSEIPESIANARLIASAPDLLAALRAIAGMKCDGDLWHGNEDGENVTNDETHDALVDALCIAREAIAQMEGAQ
jgi:hypothetical protein